MAFFATPPEFANLPHLIADFFAPSSSCENIVSLLLRNLFLGIAHVYVKVDGASSTMLRCLRLVSRTAKLSFVVGYLVTLPRSADVLDSDSS